MTRFKIYMGHSYAIVNEAKEDLNFFTEDPAGYTTLSLEEPYHDFARSYIDADGQIDYLFLGEFTNVEPAILASQDDERFQREGHFTVIGGYHEGKDALEFEGTLHDALLVIANEGEQYDV